MWLRSRCITQHFPNVWPQNILLWCVVNLDVILTAWGKKHTRNMPFPRDFNGRRGSSSPGQAMQLAGQSCLAQRPFFAQPHGPWCQRWWQHSWNIRSDTLPKNRESKACQWNEVEVIKKYLFLQKETIKTERPLWERNGLSGKNSFLVLESIC